MLNLRGVFAPVVTTFGNRDETVDLDAFATNLRAYTAAGLTGAVVCGSSSSLGSSLVVFWDRSRS